MRLMCAERERLWAEYDTTIRRYIAAVDRYLLGGVRRRWREQERPATRWTKLVPTSSATAISTAAILTQSRS